MTTPLLPTEKEYAALKSDELGGRIEAVRQKFGKRLLILGHHYQRENVIRHSDLRGDSFFLSQAAAESKDCDAIVFCGVHFMAETADILANSPEHLAERGGKRVTVSLPSLAAGCTMADMATLAELETAWTEMGKHFNMERVIPVTYVNSTAEIKAFCGRHGGLACTSSNAATVLKWAFDQGDRVLFLPDRMLGINTALKMGIPLDGMAVWSRNFSTLRATSEENLPNCRVILWDGFCGIHQRFTVEHIEQVRKDHPGICVMVHPECNPAVVDKADKAGSTSAIINAVAASPPGSTWAIGTEWNLVDRLSKEYPDKLVINLAPNPVVCPTMVKITPANLCYVLEHLAADDPVNVIVVEESVAADARICLNRMLYCQTS